jgi:hypothetical protein
MAQRARMDTVLRCALESQSETKIKLPTKNIMINFPVDPVLGTKSWEDDTIHMTAKSHSSFNMPSQTNNTTTNDRQKQAGIVEFSSGVKLEAGRYGYKASRIAQADVVSELGILFPFGFCICAQLAHRLAYAKDKRLYIRILKPFVSGLLKKMKGRRMIARSSSIYEGRTEYLFSGLFDSYVDLRTTEDVVLAIEKIVRNAKQPGLEPYFKSVGLSFDHRHMAIVVQEQIEADFSGVAKIGLNESYLEVTSGHPSSILQGSSKARALVQVDGKFIVAERRSSLNGTDDVLITEKLRLVDFSSLAKVIGTCTIEFLFSGKSCYLLQVRDNQDDELSVFESKDIDTLGTWRPSEFGSKAFAMEFFHKTGFFSEPLVILPPGTPFDEVIEKTASLVSQAGQSTIRFCRGNELGLPRAFVKTIEEAENFLQIHHQRDYFTVVHPYLNVARSFEMLIGPDFALLEHVPGMWESNSKLQPDVITIRPGEAKAYRYCSPREVISGMPDEDIASFGIPVSEHELGSFYDLLSDVREVVMASTELTLPVNVHAVYDRNSKKFQCINIRKGFLPEQEISPVSSSFFIEKIGDLRNWDGVTPLRLGLRTERGHETSLVAFAKALSKTNVPLIVEFGLLSHPSMILRDFGCRLVPSYQVIDVHDSSSYEIVQLTVDQEHDAYRRILKETPRLSTASYIVVDDREPLTSKHLLAVAQFHSKSTADTNRLEEVSMLYSVLQLEEGALFFFERGRAAFCTSGFTRPQDHFHLIGGLDEEATILALQRQFGGVEFESIIAAYSNVPSFGEYCVYGSSRLGFWMSTSRNFGKRSLRQNAVEAGCSAKSMSA